MPLNVNAPLNNATARKALVEDVLSELTQIRMRDWMGALKSWHAGSLSLMHLNVLMLLRSHGSVTMSHLADQLDVSVASATGIVDRMEKRGIVERRRSEQDRRVVEVYVSEGGEDIFRAMEASRRERLTRLIEAISDEDLAALVAGLRAFRVARDKVVPEAGPEHEPGGRA